jgi:hypothetical protein
LVALYPETTEEVDREAFLARFDATIVNTTSTDLDICFSKSAYPRDLSSEFRVEIAHDDIVYERMRVALSRLACDAEAQREATRQVWEKVDVMTERIVERIIRGTELRDVLIPEFGRPSRGSELLGNQLVRSWVERYRRRDPLHLNGDPDLGLNNSQLRAVAASVGERVSVIQGVRLFASSSPLIWWGVILFLPVCLPLSLRVLARLAHSSGHSDFSNGNSPSPTTSSSAPRRTSPSTTSSAHASKPV